MFRVGHGGREDGVGSIQAGRGKVKRAREREIVHAATSCKNAIPGLDQLMTAIDHPISLADSAKMKRESTELLSRYAIYRQIVTPWNGKYCVSYSRYQRVSITRKAPMLLSQTAAG